MAKADTEGFVNFNGDKVNIKSGRFRVKNYAIAYEPKSAWLAVTAVNITSIRRKISNIKSIVQTNNEDKLKILLIAESWLNENELEIE